MAEIVSKEAWVRRCSTTLVDEGGLDRPSADAAALAMVEKAHEWLTPEDAARDEMSYWEGA